MQAYIQRYEQKHGGGSQSNSSTNPWAKVDTPSKSANQQAGFVRASQLPQGGVGGGPPQVANERTSGTAILLCLLRLRQCCGHLSLMKDVRTI